MVQHIIAVVGKGSGRICSRSALPVAFSHLHEAHSCTVAVRGRHAVVRLEHGLWTVPWNEMHEEG